MYGELTMGSWVDIGEGCPLRFNVGGSAIVTVMCGDAESESFEFHLHVDVLERFVAQGTAALREMEELYARENPDEEE